MPYKLLSSLYFFLLANLVTSQQYISLTTLARPQQNTDSQFTCTPVLGQLSGFSVSSITLFKNSSTIWTPVVKVFSDTSSGTLVPKTVWSDTIMQNRADPTATVAVVAPTTSAKLQIKVNVTCQQTALYKCGIVAVGQSGSRIGNSSDFGVTVEVDPVSIQPITVMPNPSNSQQGTSLQYSGTYNSGQIVTLTCRGDVGNPAVQLRWCMRRNDEINYLGHPNLNNEITWGTPQLSGCQYVQTSTLRYNVTFATADFKCLTGTQEQQLCTQGIAANYTIKMPSQTVTSPQGGEGTSNAGMIAGVVIGVFVAVVIIIIIIYFVAFRKKNSGESYRTKEENGTTSAAIDNTVYSVPHKERHSPRDKDRYYENKGMDEPHTRGYRPDMDPRGRSNPAMKRSSDDVRDGNLPNVGNQYGSNYSLGSAV